MSERMRRVNRSVRFVVAETIGQLKDPRIGLVTVTGVSVSPDLHDARIYVSVLGGAKRRKATLEGLESAAGALQLALARELSLRRTPKLSFEYDPTVEHGVRLSALIDELAPEGPADDSAAQRDPG